MDVEVQDKALEGKPCASEKACGVGSETDLGMEAVVVYMASVIMFYCLSKAVCSCVKWER